MYLFIPAMKAVVHFGHPHHPYLQLVWKEIFCAKHLCSEQLQTLALTDGKLCGNPFHLSWF